MERVSEKAKLVPAILKAPEFLPFESTLAYVFSHAGGVVTAINAAQLLENEDERLKKIVYAYNTASERDRPRLKLEDLCAGAEIAPDEFLGLILPALWRRNLDIGRLIAAMAHPKVIEATVSAAQGPWGGMDRQMLHQASGFLPTKQGTSINIDNRKLNVSGGGKVIDTSAPSLPSFEQDMIEGAETLRGDEGTNSTTRIQLPAPREEQAVLVPTTPEILEAEIVPPTEG